MTFLYVGFEPVTEDVTVTEGRVSTVDATLKAMGKNEEVTVTSQQLRGEAEAINIERTITQIVSILPSDVTMSMVQRVVSMVRTATSTSSPIFKWTRREVIDLERVSSL